MLKPGGVAIFKEHVEVPIARPDPQFGVGQDSMVPSDASLTHHITEDERKLEPA